MMQTLSNMLPRGKKNAESKRKYLNAPNGQSHSHSTEAPRKRNKSKSTNKTVHISHEAHIKRDIQEMSAKGVRHSWRRVGCVLTPVPELATGLTSQSGQTLQCNPL